MADQPLFHLEDFHPATGITHVCAAGESLPLQAVNTAVSRYANDKAAGHKGRDDQTKELDKVRDLISQAWKVTSKEVGFVSSVAEGVSIILESLDWNEGDNVCVDVDEFPSLVAPFAFKSQRYQQEHGQEKSFTMHYCNAANLPTMVDKKTRLIAVSYVSYLNGARVDLSFYRRLADSVGAILVIDFTQAAGYLPIDASVADFAFSACYKWLLGTTGAAIVYWNQTRQPNWKPATAGWHSLDIGVTRPRWGTGHIDVRDDAMCFCRGNPGHLSIYILREGLDFLNQWDPCDIQKHVQTLTTELLYRLDQEGILASTPKEKERHGASVTIDCVSASKIVEELEKANIYAWNGRGRVRFSFHGYNSLKDVDRIMEVFPILWRKLNPGAEAR